MKIIEESVIEYGPSQKRLYTFRLGNLCTTTIGKNVTARERTEKKR